MAKKKKFGGLIGQSISKIFKSPLFRGTVKSLPFGNFIYEIAENIKHAKNPETASDPRPHSSISLLAQSVFLALIVYAFVTHQITIDDVLRFITADDFKDFYTGSQDSGVSVLDSIR